MHSFSLCFALLAHLNSLVLAASADSHMNVAFIESSIPSPSVSASLASTPPLQYIQNFPVPCQRVDHSDPIFGTDLLMACTNSHLDNKVIMMDTLSGAVTHEFAGKSVHSVVWLKDHQAIAYDNDGFVTFVSSRTFAHITTINGYDDCDNMQYDKRSQKVMVAFNDGHLGIIDTTVWPPVPLQPLSQTQVAGGIEEFHIDSLNKLIYIATGSGAVAVLSTATSPPSLLKTYHLPDGYTGNHPLLFVKETSQILTPTRTPPGFFVLDAKTGSVMQRFGAPPEVDGLAFDKKMKRAYVCGNGKIATYEIDVCRGNGEWNQLADTIQSGNGRTCNFVNGKLAVYVPNANLNVSASTLRLYEPTAVNTSSTWDVILCEALDVVKQVTNSITTTFNPSGRR